LAQEVYCSNSLAADAYRFLIRGVIHANNDRCSGFADTRFGVLYQSGRTFFESTGVRIQDAGSDFQTNFVGDGDLYVNSMQFAQDGQTVLVDTVARLTLYSLPVAELASEPATQPAPVSPTTPPSVLTLTVKAQVCDVEVQGWLKLQLQLCLPPSRGVAGSLDSEGQLIDLRDVNASGVLFYIPPYLQTRLAPGTYPITDFTEPGGANMTASFVYHDIQLDTYDAFYSYDTGTLILTQAGLDEDFISGSFSFGATTLTVGRSPWKEVLRTSHFRTSTDLEDCHARQASDPDPTTFPLPDGLRRLVKELVH
jgi:hypothetical protein